MLLELMKNELLVQENWTGLSAPTKTPSDVVNRLHAETVKALADPKVAEAIAARFLEPDPRTIADFTAFLKEDRERAGMLVRRYNVPKQ